MNDELLLYASEPSGFTLCKLNTPTVISRNFKQNVSFKHRTVVLNSFILVAQSDRPIINVYSFTKEGPMQKLHVPEKLTCLAASRSGKFLVAGTATGKIILWEIASGTCFAYKEAHYNAVSKIAFSYDDAVVYTVGENRLMSWRVIDLINKVDVSEIQPIATVGVHGSEITDVHVGYGTALDSRVYTVSTDRSCRVWTGQFLKLITTFVFASPIYSVVVDPAERAVYTGSEEGTIYLVEMYRSTSSRTIEYSGGLQRIVQVSADECPKFTHHSGPVLALDLNFDGSVLTSGAQDGDVHVWDVATRQTLKSIQGKKGPVYSVTVLQKMPAEDEFSNLPSLGHTADERFRASHDAWIRIPNQENEENVTFSISRSVFQIPQILSAEVGAQDDVVASVATTDGNNDAELQDLREENTRLQEAYEELYKAFSNSAEASIQA
ncbi:WD40-repeat-containing domain protein [Lipomyces japonicus]|uniref:WD40-repeat-containing domain protein n=1 Tax=Lipomyces japonicus TaxID=56871 RepID=UPI0034CEF86C